MLARVIFATLLTFAVSVDATQSVQCRIVNGAWYCHTPKGSVVCFWVGYGDNKVLHCQPRG